jgi:hypothetical protein
MASFNPCLKEIGGTGEISDRQTAPMTKEDEELETDTNTRRTEGPEKL